MALAASGLKTAIITEIENIGGFTIDNEYCKLEEFAEALATAIVSYITSNAVVTTIVTGVQSGGSTAGGTGTVS